MNDRKDIHLKGRRYLCLFRCSTTQPSETSIPDQQKLLRRFGDDNGMVHVADVVLDAVARGEA